VALLTCVIVVLIGVPMAYGMERGKFKRTQFFTRLLQLMPIAAPPMVVAFGYIILFSSDAFPYLGTTWLLILGHVVSTLPYMVQTLIGDIRHLGLVQLEQAADSLGAATVPPCGGAYPATQYPFRTLYRGCPIHRGVPVEQPHSGFSESNVSHRAPTVLLQCLRLCLFRYGSTPSAFHRGLLTRYRSTHRHFH